MDSLGNTDLWEHHLVAFFASRSVTPETENRCIAWAKSMCKTDSVIISGFHSPLEKRVLRLPSTLFTKNNPYAIISHTPELFLQRNRFDGLFFHRTSVAKFEKSNEKTQNI